VSAALLLAGAWLATSGLRHVGYGLLGAALVLLTWHTWREVFYDWRHGRKAH
jgi:hypothetical protein